MTIIKFIGPVKGNRTLKEETEMPLIEVCCGSVHSARIAQKCGGGRIELCSALQLGGYTPSWGLLTAVKEAVEIPVNAIIRFIANRYQFSEDEVDIMTRDIRMARQNGADGVVIGALTRDRKVDLEACSRFMEAAGGLPVTFHRAFDGVADQEEGLEDLIRLGCARVLTSAGKPTVPQGMDGLKKLIAQAADRIIVMPGGGVTAGNIAEIVQTLGNREIHGTFRAPGAPLAADTDVDELSLAVRNCSEKK